MIIAQPTKPRHRSRPILIGLAVLAALCLGGVIAAVATGGGGNTPTAAQPQQTSPAAQPVQPTAAATTNPPASTGIHGDGVFLVPSEVKPGTYRANVPDDSTGCYWARLKSTDGSFEAVITNDVGNAGQTMTVTVKSSDKAFETRGCGDWRKIG